MNQYFLKRASGKVSVMTIMDDSVSIEEQISKFNETSQDDLVVDHHERYDIVDLSDPFRDAWRYCAEEGFVIDIPHAQEIQKNKWRELRKPYMNELDIEYQKADELNKLDVKKTIAQKKQLLRDVTKLYISDDINILRDQIPEILKGDLYVYHF